MCGVCVCGVGCGGLSVWCVGVCVGVSCGVWGVGVVCVCGVCSVLYEGCGVCCAVGRYGDWFGVEFPHCKMQ